MALTQISTAGVKDDAVTAGKIPANAVGSSEIAANAVGSSELADNAVDTAAIVNDAVTADKIADGAVTSAHIAADTIVSGDIATGAVGATELADNAVDTAALQTNAVTTAKIADDAITNAKIADNAIQTVQIAVSQVTSNRIADQAVTLAKLPHGDGSSDGKFLRANNGADPTFESVPSPAITAINNATNNRILTSEGGTTVNSEANCTFDGGRFITKQGDSDIGMLVQNTTHDSQLRIEAAAANKNSVIMFADGDDGDVGMIDYDHNDNSLAIDVNAAERMRINSSGKVGINETSPQQQLHVHDDTAYKGILINGNGAPRIGFARSTTTTGEWSAGIDGTNGDQFVINNSNDNSDRKIIISSTQNTMAQTTQVNGNLKFGSNGNGIDFINAADVGSNETTTSSVLDDYEEGTWNPTIQGTTGAGTASYNTRTGRYTKIGNLVYLTGEINWTSGSAGGEMQVANLPFTPGTDCEGIGNMMGHVLTVGGDTANIAFYVGPGVNYAYLYQTRQGHQGWNTLNYDGDGAIIFNVQFRVS